MANIIGDSISQQMRLFVAVVRCNPIIFKQFDFKYVPVARASLLVLININRKTVVDATKPCFNTSTHRRIIFSSMLHVIRYRYGRRRKKHQSLLSLKKD